MFLNQIENHIQTVLNSVFCGFLLIIFDELIGTITDGFWWNQINFYITINIIILKKIENLIHIKILVLKTGTMPKLIYVHIPNLNPTSKFLKLIEKMTDSLNLSGWKIKSYHSRLSR